MIDEDNTLTSRRKLLNLGGGALMALSGTEAAAAARHVMHPRRQNLNPRDNFVHLDTGNFRTR
ncbi:hypothetical protein [Candidatus Methylomicrobium oryzae]|uniref:hypothetical protein n=1 Tax=Candidatus Methylomicrobium oryzae TaxID=2802053 RepID=UPI0019232F58|nr:hypothetical protein [Methylomicrobium sp. RS1]